MNPPDVVHSLFGAASRSKFRAGESESAEVRRVYAIRKASRSKRPADRQFIKDQKPEGSGVHSRRSVRISSPSKDDLQTRFACCKRERLWDLSISATTASPRPSQFERFGPALDNLDPVPNALDPACPLVVILLVALAGIASAQWGEASGELARGPAFRFDFQEFPERHFYVCKRFTNCGRRVPAHHYPHAGINLMTRVPEPHQGPDQQRREGRSITGSCA